MAVGKIIIGGTTVTFTQNFAYGARRTYAKVPEPKRTLDGTLIAYRPFLKDAVKISIKLMTATQMEAIQDAWETGTSFEFYWDGGGAKDFDGYIVREPEFETAAAFVSGVPTWNVDLEIEEV